MKRVSKLMVIPAIICFIVLMLWSEQIRGFSGFLYFMMMAAVVIGFIAKKQSSDERDAKIAKNAVEKFKQKKGIVD